MNPARYIFRSLKLHRRIHLAFMLTALVLSCVLCGALGSGGLLKKRLARMAEHRTGAVSLAIFSGQNFFLADRELKIEGCEMSAVLELSGVVSAPDDSGNSVPAHIFGIQPNFHSFFGGDGNVTGGGSGAYVSAELARRLGIGDGAEIVVRLPERSGLPADNPFSGGYRKISPMRCAVRILPPEAGGDFSTGLDSSPPCNVFLPLDLLSDKAGVKGRANIAIFRSSDSKGEVDKETAARAFFDSISLADLGLQLSPVSGGRYLELRSENAIIPEIVEDAAVESGMNPFGVFTYFANSAECGGRTSPYFFISGTTLPFLPDELGEDEIVLTEWLAGDLGAAIGDSVSVKYFASDGSGSEERTAAFRVKGIAPMVFPYVDRELAPGFDMIEGRENCSDWDSALPIDLSKVRDKDELYWDDFGAAPKAFITLEKAQKLWGSRFGKLTAVRYPAASESKELIRRFILDILTPADLGFEVVKLRLRYMDSVSNSTDFGPMFAGMSFFVVLSVVVILYLLTAVHAESRTGEAGTLRSLGFSRKMVLGLVFPELMLPILAGSLAGILASPLVMDLILLFLRRLPDSGEIFSAATISGMEPVSAVCALLASSLISGATIHITLWRAMGRTVAPRALSRESRSAKRFALVTFLVLFVSLLGFSVVAVLLSRPGSGTAAALVYFISGFGFLLSGLFFFLAALSILSLVDFRRPGMAVLAARNIGRAPGRSVAIFATSAISVFILVAVAANRPGSDSNLSARGSPSGGYSIVAESEIPISSADFAGELATAAQGGAASFLPVQTGGGDMANCLNLNKISTPRLAAVDPEELNRRKSFGFASLSAVTADPWLLLDRDEGPDCIPGFVDNSVMLWGLGKKLGDKIEYRAENGKKFNVLIAGTLKDSVMQGFVIISDRNFRKYFPSVCGYRFFLADCPRESTDRIIGQISRSFRDFGISAKTPSDVLSSLAEVERAYLDIFLLLGASGVLLGAAGLGLAAARNIISRRKEMALMSALGFPRRLTGRNLIAEHFGIFAVGILCGMLSSLLAMIPLSSGNFSGLPWMKILGAISLILAVGLLSAWFSVILWLRGEPAEGLRTE